MVQGDIVMQGTLTGGGATSSNSDYHQHTTWGDTVSTSSVTSSYDTLLSTMLSTIAEQQDKIEELERLVHKLAQEVLPEELV